jgi:cell division protein FtsB
MRNRGAKYKSIIKIIFSKSKIIIIFAVILILLVAFPLVRKINQKNALNREIAELQRQADIIEQKNSDLSEVIDYLQSNTFAEKEARVHLDMKKTGEKVVVIKDDSQEIEEQQDLDSVFILNGLENPLEIIEQANSQKWWNYFFSFN